MLSKNKIIFPETIGLVLCGGGSVRMGTDKSMLKYFKKPQRYHVFDLVKPYCEKVFISCKGQQLQTIEPGYPFLADDLDYQNIGPIAAWLTANKHFPNKNILLIGCDYPFLMENELEHFAAFCLNAAVGFYNEDSGFYEPLLAWYPSIFTEQLQEMYAAKTYSLQHFLKRVNAIKYCPSDKKCLQSVDTNAAYIEAFNLINIASL